MEDGFLSDAKAWSNLGKNQASIVDNEFAD